MLTDRAQDGSVTMFENAQGAWPKFIFRCKGIDRNILEIARSQSTVSVC